MAKPPPVERFRISCETDVTSLGPVMSALAKIPGLLITGNELITEVRSFRSNSVNPDFNTQAFVREWIKDHPSFKAKDAVHAVRAASGTGGTATYPALTKLIEEGALKKVGEGMYSRADVKALAAPKAKAKAKKVIHDVSATDFTLRVMSRNHGKISSATLKKHFENDKRVATGTGPVLRKLVADKRIKRVGEGLYELAPKKTDKLNGKAPVEIEVPANG